MDSARAHPLVCWSIGPLADSARSRCLLCVASPSSQSLRSWPPWASRSRCPSPWRRPLRPLSVPLPRLLPSLRPSPSLRPPLRLRPLLPLQPRRRGARPAADHAPAPDRDLARPGAILTRAPTAPPAAETAAAAVAARPAVTAAAPAAASDRRAIAAAAVTAPAAAARAAAPTATRPRAPAAPTAATGTIAAPTATSRREPARSSERNSQTLMHRVSHSAVCVSVPSRSQNPPLAFPSRAHCRIAAPQPLPVRRSPLHRHHPCRSTSTPSSRSWRRRRRSWRRCRCSWPPSPCPALSLAAAGSSAAISTPPQRTRACANVDTKIYTTHPQALPQVRCRTAPRQTHSRCAALR